MRLSQSSLDKPFRTASRPSEHGNVIISLLTMLGSGALIALVIMLVENNAHFFGLRLQQTRQNTNLSSAIETFLVAHRAAEVSYLNQLSDCVARPFLTALNTGHGCANKTVTIYQASDDSDHSYTNLYSYTHANGCTIKENEGLRCDGSGVPLSLVTIGKPLSDGTPREMEKVNGFAFEMILNAITPEKQLAEFVARIEGGATATGPSRVGFALRAALANAAHLEADGRVTQERPDPQNPCGGEEWADYLIFNYDSNACEKFVQLGGGTGLTFYGGRFFGFRPSDGQVIDMLAANNTASTSYMVDPASGKTCGTCDQIFPTYDQDALVNTDDITTIKNQIYYVANSGASAEFGVLVGANRIPLCPLGAMGWSQAYSGIAALGWSDPLYPETPLKAGKDLTAFFFLKTDSGDFLASSAVVSKGNKGASEDHCVNFSAGGNPYHSCCSVYKDESMQQVEYKRTLGFDRAANAKPYYIF